MCPGAHFSVSSGMHLFRFDSVTTKASVQMKSIWKCAPPLAPSKGHGGSLQIWGLLKYVKKSWWPLAHAAVDNLTSGSPEWERAGGTAWHTHRALVLVLGSLPPTMWGRGREMVWHPAETSWLCSSQRAASQPGCSVAALPGRTKIISIFMPFCLMFFTGVKFIAVFFMKGAKIPQTTDHTNWLIQQAGAFYRVFWWICCKSWKIKSWAWYN